MATPVSRKKTLKMRIRRVTKGELPFGEQYSQSSTSSFSASSLAALVKVLFVMTMAASQS